MTKPFAASAFRAYASFDVSETQRSNSFFVDGPRGSAALPRWADAFDAGSARGQLLGSVGFGDVGAPSFSHFTLAAPAAARVEAPAPVHLQPMSSPAFTGEAMFPALVETNTFTADAVNATFAAAATSDYTARCGCASCMSYAQTQAEKAAYAEAAWAAYEAGELDNMAIDPGQTGLLDDIGDDSAGARPLDAQEGSIVESQIDHPLDQDWFSANLSAGTQYKFILTPDDTSGDPGSPDFLIEIYDSAGVLIQSYDSGSFGATERVTFTPADDGLYYVVVKGWTPADVGGYTLTAEINNNPTPGESGVLASLNWGGNDNVVDTGNYDANGAMIIKVYFSQTGDAPYGSPDDPVVGVTWDSWAKDGCFAAFACYENVINVVFEEVFTQEEADFILAATATAPVILGRMRPPGEANEGLGEFNVLASTWTEEGTAQGGYMWITFIHELGHGMGLAHPHDTGGGSEVMQGVSGDLATGYTYGDFDLNQGVFTTMSYNDGWQTAPHGNSDSDAYGYQGTLMALDIALLQIKYGANTTYNNTDTVYALPDSNQPGTYYQCIWDTGGTDWIIAGAAVDCVIDLRAATLEYEEGGGGFISYEAGTFGGFTIAAGVVIENAIGGAGEDTINGNTAANWLMGGLGNDAISGGDGDDRIEGGADDDNLDGGAGADTLDYSTASGGVTVDMRLTTAQNTVGAGVDTLAGFEHFTGSDFADNVIGTSADNTMDGGDGHDTLNGHIGNDLLDGGDGNDVLKGGSGIDTTTGGLGDDWHYVDNAADVVNETTGQGSDRVLANVDYALAADDDVELLTTWLASSTFAINLTGNALDQRIEGNAGANTLSGLDGADTLAGYDGADTLLGGAGNDILEGGLGVDTTNGGLGNDLHYVDNAADVVVEAAGEGTNDRVATSVSYTLAAGVEVELFTTSTGGDLDLTGNAFSQTIVGNAGANTLSGMDGNDVLRGNGGVDTTIGGNGDDDHWVDNAGDVVVEGAGEGADDQVLASVSYTLGAGVHVEVLSTTNYLGSSAINLTGNELDNRIEGNAGANTLSGMDGADSISGYGGDDTINGGAGNDVLDGGAGTDTTNGGLGDDLHYVDSAADVVVEAAGEGTADHVLSAGSYTLAAGVEVEILTTTNSAGVTAINFTGNATGQRIVGNAGVNTLDGGDGADDVRGMDGADILIGGGGNDILRGGAGGDTFLFNAGLFGADTVTDYVDGSDLFQFNGIAGVDDFSDLAITANGGNALITLPDGSTITLTGVASGVLDASDFVFGP